MFSGCVHGELEQERAEIWEQRNTCTRSADRIYLSKGDVTNYNGIGRREDVRFSDRESNEFNQNGQTKYVSNSESIGQEYALENGELEGKRFRKSSERNFWDSFPLESPICGGDDGIPTELDGITFSKWRNESIKAYGNAIVPQIAFELFKQLEKI